jgi:1-deoxy-D-xylulose-5-phosphate reductoisomerase
MASTTAMDEVRQALAGGTANPPVCATAGADGLEEVATHPDADIIVCATSGTAALQAVLAAIVAGKTIALANKEVLVMAGALMMEAARTYGATILPVDSEHNAVHQCLQGRVSTEVTRLLLTASGGPFRSWPADKLRDVTPKQALDHPTWDMGPKITVDSSTLMNKGLEVIEARWLFDVGPERIDVVVHPQSVVHSLVELRDGSVIAQLGVTDMRLPIQYALSYPERWETELPRLDLAACGRLDFFQPDTGRFPCLGLAYRALEGGSALPVMLNAANEVAVDAFLAKRLSFPGIAALIERTLDSGQREGWSQVESLAAVREADSWARRFSRELAGKVKSDWS